MFKRLFSFLILDPIRSNAHEIEYLRMEIEGLRQDTKDQTDKVRAKAERRIAMIRRAAAKEERKLRVEMNAAVSKGEKLQADEMFKALPSRVSKGWTEHHQ
jgi:hypothetical protein